MRREDYGHRLHFIIKRQVGLISGSVCTCSSVYTHDPFVILSRFLSLIHTQAHADPVARRPAVSHAVQRLAVCN